MLPTTNRRIQDVLLRYFDMTKPTFLFVDAHITGLGATLAQGNSIRDAKPVAFASRTTSLAETRYPQLDLEAMSLDFGLSLDIRSIYIPRKSSENALIRMAPLSLETNCC